MTPAQHSYPLTIHGDRITLRDFTPDDLGESMEIVGDSRVTDFLSFDAKTLAEQTQLLGAQIEGAQRTPRTEYYLAIERIQRRSVIGFARLGIGAHRSAKLGYAIRWDAWGHGFATEAAGLLVGFGFASLGLHRITAACGPENAASSRVLVKLGFTLEGRLRDHAFTNGAWRDSLLYSLLITEYPPAHEGAGAAPATDPPGRGSGSGSIPPGLCGFGRWVDGIAGRIAPISAFCTRCPNDCAHCRVAAPPRRTWLHPPRRQWVRRAWARRRLGRRGGGRGRGTCGWSAGTGRCRCGRSRRPSSCPSRCHRWSRLGGRRCCRCWSSWPWCWPPPRWAPASPPARTRWPGRSTAARRRTSWCCSRCRCGS